MTDLYYIFPGYAVKFFLDLITFQPINEHTQVITMDIDQLGSTHQWGTPVQIRAKIASLISELLVLWVRSWGSN